MYKFLYKFIHDHDLLVRFTFDYGEMWGIMAVSVLAAVLNVVLNYIFISRFGYQAIGYTLLLCFIIYCTVHNFFMNKVCYAYGDVMLSYKGKNMTETLHKVDIIKGSLEDCQEQSILFINPVFKQMPWGGDKLKTEWEYQISGNDTGECWAISAILKAAVQ